MEIPNGVIVLGSKEGNELGFTVDRFKNSWLWKAENSIYISLLISIEPGIGHFNALLDRIWELGYTVKVPCPLRQMEEIIKKKGFVKTREGTAYSEMVDVWVKDPPKEKSNEIQMEYDWG